MNDVEIVEYRYEEVESDETLGVYHSPITAELKVRFRFYNAGLGVHPDVPPGTLFVHPLTLQLFRGFIVEGDIVYTSGSRSPVEVLSSDLAFPPLLSHRGDVKVPKDEEELKELLSEHYRIVYVGGFLLHGLRFVPPFLPIDKEKFSRLVSTFKGTLDRELLASVGIPPEEPYLRMVGPFFGYHVPNAVQLVDEMDWRDLVRQWSSSDIVNRPFVEIGLKKHPEVSLVSTTIHGFYPRKTPWKVYVCPEGHLSPLSVCPICGKPTKPVKICPRCGRYFEEGDRCPYDGSKLLDEITFDPEPVIRGYEERYGKVGEVNIVDGPPEHPLKAYFRKKTNLYVGRSGFVELSSPIFPGDRNEIPKVLVNPILRVYRFLSFLSEHLLGERGDFPSREEELVGRRIVVVSSSKYFVVEIERIGERLTLRKNVFYGLPSKEVSIGVFEDVVLNAGIKSFYVIKERRDFPYHPYPQRSLFDGELRTDILVNLYNEVVALTGADPSFAIPLLFPLLRERETLARRTPKYRCTSCGLELPRRTLSGKCPRCGGELEKVEEPPSVDVEDLIERFKENQKLVLYLRLFRKRLGSRDVQKTILDLF